jgi:hypothetical protein
MMDHELPEMKRNKKNNMDYYYFELDSVGDTIDSIGTNNYGIAANMLIDDSSLMIDNNMPGYFPDFVFASTEEVETAVVNGTPKPVYALVGGYHPSQRPPARPR